MNQHSESGFLGSRGLLILLVCAVACSIVIPALSGLAFFRSEAPATVSHPAGAGLTFAERVAYQRAIEEVYWRHRIWPKENPDPKPSLDAVMSQAQLEKKIEAYLPRVAERWKTHWQQANYRRPTAGRDGPHGAEHKAAGGATGNALRR